MWPSGMAEKLDEEKLEKAMEEGLVNEKLVRIVREKLVEIVENLHEINIETAKRGKGYI